MSRVFGKSFILVMSMLGSCVTASLNLNDLCTTATSKTHPKPQFQATYPHSDRLHLIINQKVYTVPLTADYINSQGGEPRLALFDRISSRPIMSLGPWNTALKELGVNFWRNNHDRPGVMTHIDSQICGKFPILVCFLLQELLQNGQRTLTISKDQNRDLIYKPISVPFVIITNNVHRDIKSVLLRQDPTDSNRTLYQAFQEYKPARDLIKNPDEKFPGSYFAYLSKNQKSIAFQRADSTIPPKFGDHKLWDLLLVGAFSATGFILNDSVYLWDLGKERVIQFDFPVKLINSTVQGTELHAKVIPFTRYFVCNQTEWNKAGAASKLADRKMFKFVGWGLALVLVIAVVSGFILYCRRKKRRTTTFTVPPLRLVNGFAPRKYSHKPSTESIAKTSRSKPRPKVKKPRPITPTKTTFTANGLSSSGETSSRSSEKNKIIGWKWT